MKRPSLPRPSLGRLSAMLAGFGVIVGLAFLLIPVDAGFADDPLLHLQPFSPGLVSAATHVECGRPVSNLGRRPAGLSLYDLARDDACRAAAGGRAAKGVAAGAVIGLLGLIGLAGTRMRTLAVA